MAAYKSPKSFDKSTTLKVPISGIDDLTSALRWFNELLPDTAIHELAAEQSRGNLLVPITYVDGKKNPNVETVEPFGTITYADDVGPLMAQAIAAADAFVRSRAPRKSGWYAESLVWNLNGRRVGGPPDPNAVGAKGNVQLFDLAPYASVVEVDVPRGVIFGAYMHLLRRFGDGLKVGFQYVLPLGEWGTLRGRPNNPPRVPYYIPVLTFGGPASSVIPGVAKSIPGYSMRRGSSPFKTRGQQVRYEKKWKPRK